jgi:hypothetical protein
MSGDMHTAPKYRLFAIPMTMRSIAPLDCDNDGSSAELV